MENFRHRGKIIEFTKFTGEVVDFDRISETHISASLSGGGGNDGYISPMNFEISSKSVTNHQFWLKSEDGTEREFCIKGDNLPIRKSQKVTVLMVNKKKKNKRYYFVVINHTAKTHSFTITGPDVMNALKLEKITGISVIISAAIGFGVYSYLGVMKAQGKTLGLPDSIQQILVDPSNFILVAAVSGAAYFILRVIYKLRRMFKVGNRFQNHVNGIIEDIKKSV